ncbi:MAG: PP2C family protein-serine/threonine phosphatase [Terriglobia bacterium]
MLKSLANEYRSHRWAKFAAGLGVLALAVWIAERIAGLFTHTWQFEVTFGVLWLIVKIAVVVVVIYYIGRLIGVIRRRMLWRLTRRLIVTYTFIAIVPIILILVLVGLGASILSGQFAAYLVNARVREHVDELKQVNRVVAHEAGHIQSKDPKAVFDALEDFYQSDIRPYAASYPGLEVTLRIGAAGSARGAAPAGPGRERALGLSLGAQERAFHLSGQPMQRPLTEPRWLTGEEWSGVMVDRGQVLLASVEREPTAAGPITMILSMPITPGLLNLVGQGIGPVVVIPLVPPRRVIARRNAANRTAARQSNAARSPVRRPPPPPQRVQLYGEQELAGYRVQSNAVPLPAPRHWFDFRVRGASALTPVLWWAPKYTEGREPVMVIASSRVFPLNTQLLSILGRFSGFWVIAFIVIGAIFLQIEIASLVIGILLTRSITKTVSRLQAATERVKSGDFSHRIGLAPHDQLSALGVAFDTMTASVERLMAESRDRLRLEGELRIAHEVQQQLFPQGNPDVPGARMFGECRPARGVSGDFYDFLKLGRNRVGLALGDVSGKGIYAALLMAGIQSAVRAQFYDGYHSDGVAGAFPVSTASVVDRLNRQIYENTPDGKYATFFYAVYDGAAHSLSYTNAGHPAPFLFRGNTLQRLQTGGTVIGLFPATQYRQEQIQLDPGDVLLAFTDGLIEPENAYGEEFGEERLASAVRAALDSPPNVLADEVYRAVLEWSQSSELEDDMTLLYLKATG